MVETQPPERRGDPNVAALLSWFLPGAGHLYLGRVGFGLLAMLIVEGLYALGWFLSDGRTFEYLDPELRGPLATLLTPEAGNLGAMILHLRQSGFGAIEPVPFPPAAVVGSFLCALSGILSLLVSVQAHLDAREVGRVARAGHSPVLLLGCAWLCPGLGHWLQGRRRRAVIVFVLLLGLFLAGTAFAHGTNLSRERHFYYWSGQFLLGGPAILAEALAGHPRVSSELPLADIGLLYACLAGLLNVLAWLDVFGVAESRWFASARASGATPAEGPAAGGGSEEPSA